MRVSIYLSLITAALLAGAGQVMFKLGADGRTSLTAFVNAWIVAGLLSYGVGTLLWIYSLSKAPLSLVYPFTALSFVFVYAAGVLLLNEETSPKAAIGVGLVLLGLYLVQSSK
jgi:drug/metabolite transporter (DMT)-like permease